MSREFRLLTRSAGGIAGSAISATGVVLAFAQIGLLKGPWAIVIGLVMTAAVGVLTEWFVAITGRRDRARDDVHRRLIALSKSLQTAAQDLRSTGRLREEEYLSLVRELDEVDPKGLSLSSQLTARLVKRLELLRSALELLRKRSPEDRDQDVTNLAVGNLEVAADTVASFVGRVANDSGSAEAAAS